MSVEPAIRKGKEEASKNEQQLQTPRQNTNRAAPFISPSRVARLEEQKELTTLNKRLETVIYQNREAETAQKYAKRDLEMLRARHSDELNRQKDHYEREIADRRRERDNLTEQNGKKDTEIVLLRNRLAEATKDLGSEQERRQQLDSQLVDRTEQLNQEIERVKTAHRQVEREREMVGHELEKMRHRVDRLESDEKGLKESHNSAVQNQNDALAQLKALKEDHDLLKSQFEEKSQIDAREVAELTEKNDHMERRLREDFSSQMTELITHRINQCEKEKNECLEEMKSVYDEKLRAFREKVEQQQLELYENERKMKDQRQDFQARHKRAGLLEYENESLRRQVKDLLISLEEANKKPEAEYSHLRQIVKKMKEAYRRKEAEFDSLMDVKIALANEIKAYRTMVESEEQRFGIFPAGSRKRRKLDLEGEYSESPQSSSSSDNGGEEQKSSNPTLLISQVDIDGGSVSIRNCLTRPVSLQNYTLVTDHEGETSTFPFPQDFKLAAGASVKIIADPEEEANPPHTLVWGGRPFSAGDAVRLVSASGVEVSRSPLFHETRGDSQCNVM